MTRVSAGPYTLEIPPNGVAVLYEADGAGNDHQLPGGVGYLDALVQFAGEVIRLRAMVDGIRHPTGSERFSSELSKRGPMSTQATQNMSAGQQLRRKREERKKKMLVDQKCVDLAQYFLDASATPDDLQNLAEMIQQTCEDFMAGDILE